MYQLTLDENVIKKLDGNGGGVFIPVNEVNADYREYLEWVALGNEPLPVE